MGDSVRMRFAPIPYRRIAHGGNIRTALFNLIFAGHNRGSITPRIEDQTLPVFLWYRGIDRR
ncbi:MAG TPA: glutamate--tRNA ligase family protein [Dehalococcoidia bacterium]|nr:glutamate--tRNA ligase family protein [Dehalococcoidia bacterium]